MIPKVGQDFLDFIEELVTTDLDDQLTRSPAFQFYASDWLSSSATALMDAEQQGWFLNLLARAWWDGNPQTMLPADNEALLKKLAKYKEPQVLTSRALAELDHSLSELLDYPARWAEVRAKFRPVPGHPNLLYNPKLTRVLFEATLKRRERRRSGLKGVEVRLSKQRSYDHSLSSGQATDKLRSSSGQAEPKLRSSSSSSTSSSRSVGEKPNLPSLSVSEVSDGFMQYVTEEPEPAERGGKAGKERGTRFNPQKFIQFSTAMLAWNQAHYSEFQEGDWNFLKEKFIGVFTGKIKQHWPRTWYNFVNNEVVYSGYRPGDYDWRNKNNGKPSQQGVSLNEQRRKEQQAIIEAEERAASTPRVENGNLLDKPPSALLPPNDPD